MNGKLFSSLKELGEQLLSVGYHHRREELLAVAGMLRRLDSGGGRGIPALILEGPPGAGKTFLAECVAEALGGSLVVQLSHPWLDDQELFSGVDIAAAVAGDASSVRQDGSLAVAARRSHKELVVLLLDEIDKAPKRVENLLLDFLQSGRVPLAPGKQLVANRRRMLVFVTSNGVRPLGDAFLRRVRRLVLQPLPVGLQEEILAAKTGLPSNLVSLVWRAAREVARAEGNDALSLQEGWNLLDELLLAESVNDVKASLAGWAARQEAGRKAAYHSKLAAAVWSLLKGLNE